MPPPKKRVAVAIDMESVVKHHHEIFTGIKRYASEREDWECIIDPFAQRLMTRGDSRGRLDGVVGRATIPLAEASRRSGIPVVNVWRNTPTHGLPTVITDVQEAGRMAARHLLARGLRNFAFLGYVEDKASDLQFRGFKEIIDAERHPCHQFLIERGYDAKSSAWQKFQRQMARWLEEIQKPIGVCVSFDLLARYFVEACHLHRCKVPFDIAIVGSANEVTICTNAEPTLSSIDFGYEEVGHRAAALLDELMNGAPPPVDPVLVTPKGLVARQSSDAYVTENPEMSRAMRFMLEHAHESIDVGDVAEHISTSRWTLARLFQRQLGKTVHNVLNQIRIERVKRVLLEPDSVVKTVAVECGFRDATHLIRVFKRVEGVTPTEYRARRGWTKTA